MEANRRVEDNMRLVYHLYKNLGKTDFVLRNKDDLISEGMVGLIKASKSYDDGKSRFATYASRCIMNQMLMYIRRCKYEGREVSLDAPVAADDSGNELTYADIIPDDTCNFDQSIGAADLKARFRRFYFQLNAKQRVIVKLRCKGLRQRQIADRLKLSQSYVSRLLKKMKTAYKKAA
jgi:RNA polymerase sporulation-specific sigma factor